MIDGFCVGGGMSVALACDLRLASESSRFGIPAARLGLGYNYASVARLVALVGPMHASDILFTARQIPAAEALQIGLVDKVVPSAELEALVASYTAMIADNAPLTIRASKLAISQTLVDPTGATALAWTRRSRPASPARITQKGVAPSWKSVRLFTGA